MKEGRDERKIEQTKQMNECINHQQTIFLNAIVFVVFDFVI